MNSAQACGGIYVKKGLGDPIIQPAPSGAEDSSVSDRVYAQNRSSITVSSGGSCGNWLDARKI
jgi:hypothetical protein